MKKKYLSIILLVVICLTLVLSCAACWDFATPITPPNGSTGDTDKPTDGTDKTQGENTGGNTGNGDKDADKNTDDTNPDNNGSIDDSKEPDKDKNPDNSDSSSGNGNDNKPSDNENDDKFEDYGMNVITVVLKDLNVNENGIYNTKEEVGAYIYLYNKLPGNYVNNRDEAKRNYTAQNKISFGGAVFYNREGLLPKAAGRTYTECDIAYKGGNRNALRIVFSSDGLIFYTSDHYSTFSIMRFV